MHYILRGQYDAALRQLAGARTSGAAPADVENLRGLALMLKGNTAEALTSFERALTLDPSLLEARYNRGLVSLRLGRHTSASADFEAVWQKESSPLRAEAAYHLGIALDRGGRHAEAEKWLERAHAMDSQLDAALLYIGMLRERRGDVQGAGRAYLSYLEAHPDSPVAALRFGLAAQRGGRTDVARAWLEKVIAVAPQSDEAIEARKFLVMWD